MLTAYLGTLNLLANLKLKLADQSPLSTHAQYLHKQAMNEFIKAVIVLRKDEVKSKIASLGQRSVEHLWEHLRENNFGNRAFPSLRGDSSSTNCAQ